MGFLAKSVFMVSLSISSLASATIIDNGNYTTVNGVDWLDLTETKGMSVNEALTLFSNDGWAVATNAEFSNMYDSFYDWDADTILGVTSEVQFGTGFPQYSDTYSKGADYYDESFSEFFGTTASGIWNLNKWQQAFGFYSNGVNDIRWGGTYTTQDADVSNYDALVAYHSQDSDAGDYATKNASYGVFLVRSPTAVPEPSSLVLMGLALLGILRVNRRRTQA